MKKMKLNFFVLLGLSLSQIAVAQNTFDVLRESKWGTPATTVDVDDEVAVDVAVKVSTSKRAPQSCEKKDQNSIPYKDFIGLLDGKKLDITHDSSAGTFKMNGGMMISNCNSMLRYNFSEPQAGRPYLFQVEIRKPSDCNSDKCEYSVAMAGDSENPNIKTGDEAHKFTPDYYGFKKCLETAGVIVGGKLNESKIVPSPFKYKENGLTETNEIAWYSHGPARLTTSALFGDIEASGGSCDFFEKITKNGHKFYSQEDVDRNEKQNLFDKICTKGDYLLIEKHLPEFAEIESLLNILKKVRDHYLLAEIKDLHKELDRKDYS
jgi:hypothetical protein